MGQTDWSKLVGQGELNYFLRERKKTYEEKVAWRSSLSDEESEGWYFYKDTSNAKKIKVRKAKSIHEVFENRVWVLLASMGFTSLNRDQSFTINYSLKGEDLDKQIDVFAVDDETVLVVECKCAENVGEKKQWKTEIEAINGYMGPVRNEIKKQFPNRNIKFIFATQNYVVGDYDKKRMAEFSIAHFDEKTIKYYEELVRHIGSCARYQLLGSLFAGKTITGMNNRIPAIRGKMGGYTYYVFSVQPEVLLKIGYVLHRSEANENVMPTYQRIIKKARLKAVHEFIENHGFFPNSILISIDTKNGVPLRFDLSEKQGNDDVTKLGLLYLPNEYRRAFIIDGQHRLYGYSDSKYSRTNSIPVVAFENMPQDQQVRLFMEINENQKAVPKNLRNTLNADLLWYSDKPTEKREAIRSRIAQDLGDNMESALYGRVIIGEDQSDDKKCITLEMICSAIKDTSFLSKFNKDMTLQESGLFDVDNNEKTLKLIEKYLFRCFGYIKEILPKEWEIEQKKDRIILFNNGIGGFIRLFDDIAIQLKDNGHDPKKIDEFLKEIDYYLDPLEEYFLSLSDEAKNELRNSYGGNGPKDYWRNLEKAINKAHPSFVPNGFIKYWEDHDKSHLEDSISIMAYVEKNARACVKKLLISNYTDWKREIPRRVYTAASNAKTKSEYDSGDNKEIWEYFTMSDLCEIITFGSKWSTLFDKLFTLPSEMKKTGGKTAKTEWMKTIDKLQKNVGRSTFNITKQEREMLIEAKELVAKWDEASFVAVEM